MPTEFEGLKAKLLQTDAEFRQLATKHHDLDERLHAYADRHYLTEPEQAEETTLLGRLVTVNGLEVTEIPITTEEFTIGRDPSCNYVIDQPFISPRHCTIMLRKKTFFIRDLGGKNGTFVNGERLPKNRDIPVPLGSEVNLTMNISMELWDAKTVVKLHDRKTSFTHHSSVATKTAQASDELELRSVFGIKFAGEDEGKVGDDYSPI